MKTKIQINIVLLGIILIFFNSCKEKSNNYHYIYDNYDISEILQLDSFVNVEFGIENLNNWSQRNIYGYIGENKQRFFIKFNSVKKSTTNSAEYYVCGKTMVKNNICNFQGKMIFNPETYEVIAPKDITQPKGSSILLLNGKYEFFENHNQNYSGFFEGNFSISLLKFDNSDKLYYDISNFCADGFSNLGFIGTWTDYKTLKSKKCNWGDYRIPESEGLDIGIPEFLPDAKYSKYGWRSFVEAYGYSEDITSLDREIAREEEQEYKDKLK